MKAKTSLIAALVLSAALFNVTGAVAAERNHPAALPFSNAFGQSLQEWLGDYWAWTLNGQGSQAQPNGVVFMPLPDPAEWGPLGGHELIGAGEMSLTVKPGTKLLLGAYGWAGEVGGSGEENAPWPVTEFLPPYGETVITLDGIELVNANNLQDFYYGPVLLNETTWVQGIGVVFLPLPPGEHTLTLYTWNRWRDPAFPDGFGWFNTWHITVSPPGQ